MRRIAPISAGEVIAPNCGLIMPTAALVSTYTSGSPSNNYNPALHIGQRGEGAIYDLKFQGSRSSRGRAAIRHRVRRVSRWRSAAWRARHKAKPAPAGGQRDAARPALKERAADIGLERLDPSRDVRLNGVELYRRAVHAAQARHRLEDLQI